MSEQYVALPTDRQKGKALERRMRDQEISQQALAKLLLFKSRSTVASWWKGEFWPLRLEAQIEQLLDVPKGFFSRIAQGVKYEHALVTRAPVAVVPLSTDQYREIMDLLARMEMRLEAVRLRVLAQEHGTFPNGHSFAAQDLGG